MKSPTARSDVSNDSFRLSLYPIRDYLNTSLRLFG